MPSWLCTGIICHCRTTRTIQEWWVGTDVEGCGPHLSVCTIYKEGVKIHSSHTHNATPAYSKTLCLCLYVLFITFSSMLSCFSRDTSRRSLNSASPCVGIVCPDTGDSTASANNASNIRTNVGTFQTGYTALRFKLQKPEGNLHNTQRCSYCLTENTSPLPGTRSLRILSSVGRTASSTKDPTNKTSNVRIHETSRRVRVELLPWKSNTYYIFSVCL